MYLKLKERKKNHLSEENKLYFKYIGIYIFKLMNL